jgi:acyl carrier protein
MRNAVGRVNSGPAANPNALRRDRRTDQAAWTRLPAAGRPGEAPAWPLTRPSAGERVMWAALDARFGEGPATPVRRAVRDLWERLLPVGTVGLDEDFMLLGGDSLLAAQMLVALEHDLGVTVPMGELVHARTVRELSEVVVRLQAAAQGAPSTVACVQAGDPTRRPRLWFVHDLQGSAYRVRHVAAALGEDQPVWSFESPLLRGGPNPFTALDTFAARYVTDLLEAHAAGRLRATLARASDFYGPEVLGAALGAGGALGRIADVVEAEIELGATSPAVVALACGPGLDAYLKEIEKFILAQQKAKMLVAAKRAAMAAPDAGAPPPPKP